MATTAQINAICDGVLAVFGDDAQAIADWTAFLTRGLLEQQLAELQSEERNIREEYEVDTSEYVAALEANQSAQNDKQAEIDAL